jgi:16S rRNA (guanine527-N7)-methyltransferase
LAGESGSDKSEFLAWLRGKYGSLSDDQIARVVEYGDLLKDATDRMGIVSRGDRERLLTRHVKESLAPELVGAIGDSWRVLDVGAGGGLPGIPLAIVRPDLQVTLLEARNSKVAFLERVKLTMGLSNVFVRAGRMEEMSGAMTGRWDCAIARAVAWNSTMVRALRGCVAENGFLVRYGSPQGPVPDGVKIVPLEASNERALQFWPPKSWDALPKPK